MEKEKGKEAYVNNAQLKYMLSECQENLIVAGRGVAKTSGIHAWDQRRKAIYMPGSKGLFVSETYQQALTRTLPSLIGGLRRLGVYKDLHYVVGKKPDKKLGFKEPIEPPIQGYDHCLTFRSGRILQLVSLDIKGSANGINSDDISGDEVKYLDKVQYEEEVLPTMRANETLFGHLHFHWSINLTTSMPTLADGKWILKRIDEARDPEKVNGKNQIIIESLVYQKLDLMAKMPDASKTMQSRLMTEINRIDREIEPYRFGSTFTLEADTFENISVLTEKYIRRMRGIMDDHTFNSEIMNMRPLAVEKCFYAALDLDKHTYPHFFNNTYLASIGLNTRYKENCLQDADCIPSMPLHITIDWGAIINSMSIGHYYNPAHGHTKHSMEPINCMYVTWPNGIDDLADMFCDYYSPHFNRDYHLHHDPKTGWERRPNNKVFSCYVEQFMARLKARGWNCIFVTRQEMPTHMSRWLMWMRILKGNDTGVPSFRANKLKAKLALNSMFNTPTKEDHRGISKDKDSEKANSGILPQDATHFGDTMDIWAVDIMRGISTNHGQYFDLNK